MSQTDLLDLGETVGRGGKVQLLCDVSESQIKCCCVMLGFARSQKYAVRGLQQKFQAEIPEI
jgi:hypothetical protein